MAFYVLCFMPFITTFQALSDGLLQGGFSLSGFKRLGSDSHFMKIQLHSIYQIL